VSVAHFRFFGDLDDFLIVMYKGRTIEYPFTGNPSIKHLIEALRVPHTEVGGMLVNGEPVDFSYPVKGGDQVQIYPATSKLTGYLHELESLYLDSKPHFILDNHLGKLATYLRMLGFDTLYRNDFQDKELVEIACREKRILLTRDRGLLMHRSIAYGHCLRTMEPKEQVVEVLRFFDLFEMIQPFQRCLRCNTTLQVVSKDAVIDRLEPLTRRYYQEFHLCPNCNQIYWKGSHYERMERFLENIKVSEKRKLGI
jgi:hypothetical protein